MIHPMGPNPYPADNEDVEQSPYKPCPWCGGQVEKLPNIDPDGPLWRCKNDDECEWDSHLWDPWTMSL